MKTDILCEVKRLGKLAFFFSIKNKPGEKEVDIMFVYRTRVVIGSERTEKSDTNDEQ